MISIQREEMPKVSEDLRDAQILADFSNLNAADVDYFRRNFPDFLPDKWWDYRNGDQRRMTQRLLRESWENHFSGGVFFVTRLVLSVFDPDDTDGLNEIIHGTPQIFASLADIPWGSTPFQRAVLYLFAHNWRARFCPVCNKRFVAAEPKNKFCSSACSEEDRRRQKREWFRKHGKAWRRARRG
jgi:hypothetical protein